MGPRRSKRWFRIVQCDGEPTELAADDDEQCGDHRVLAVDCTRTDALRLTTVTRAGGEDDDADESASMHEQAEAVWRLTACGRLVNRRMEAHGLVLDAAPMRKFLRCEDETETSVWHPALAPRQGDAHDAHAATQVRQTHSSPSS